MRRCKVRHCKRKHIAKGYCTLHYYRKRNGRSLIRKCKDCGRNITNKLQCTYCKRCSKKRWENHKKIQIEKFKNNYVIIPRFGLISGKRIGKCCVYTNGVTEQIKPLIPKIKDKVLRDCIKNPRKYLK